MDKKEAIDILIANAVCGDTRLHCDDDCPLYDKETGKCPDYSNKLVEAVKISNGKLQSNKQTQ